MRKKKLSLEGLYQQMLELEKNGINDVDIDDISMEEFKEAVEVIDGAMDKIKILANENMPVWKKIISRITRDQYTLRNLILPLFVEIKMEDTFEKLRILIQKRNDRKNIEKH